MTLIVYFKNFVCSQRNITLLKCFFRLLMVVVCQQYRKFVRDPSWHKHNIPIYSIGIFPSVLPNILLLKRDGSLNACNPNQVFVLNFSRFEQGPDPTASTGLNQETSPFCGQLCSCIFFVFTVLLLAESAATVINIMLHHYGVGRASRLLINFKDFSEELGKAAFMGH